MSMNELAALIPLIMISMIPVVIMLVVAFVRNHLLTNIIASGGFLLSLVFVLMQINQPAVQVTGLIYIDAYNMFFVACILGAAAAVSVLSFGYFEQVSALIEEYYILLSLALLGAAVLICSSHFVTFFIGIELLGISIFAMVGYLVTGSTRLANNLEASVKYMILSGISSSFLLFGIALIYADTGMLAFVDLANHFNQVSSVLSGLGLFMVLVGIGFKLSLVPFHVWTPDVYQGAPLPVTTFLASVSKVAVSAFAIRFFVESGARSVGNLTDVLSVIAAATILTGNLLALKQNNIQRMLAYSSIAHFGYLMLSFVAVAMLLGAETISTNLAIETVGLYLVAYLLMTICAFGVLIVLSDPAHSQEVESMDAITGLMWRRPLLATIFTVALLSLAGIPLTMGFMGKFMIIAVGVSNQLWMLLIVVVAGSAMGLYYYLKVILYMIKPVTDSTVFVDRPIDPGAYIVIVGLTLVTLILGIFPAPIIQWIRFTVAQI